MALQHSDYTRLLKSSEAATTVLTDADLQTSAQDDDEAKRWTSMSRDLHYILINICSGSAATVVRQQGVVGDNNGFETFRVLHQRFSLPVGTRSIGYLTTLLKPKFEEQSFEENFLQWEYDVARYELDNGQALPDTVKIAILLNETKRALQQHLQLRAGQVTTYSAMRSIVVEYYRATTTLSKLKMMHNPSTNNYNGPQPMDIGLTWKGYKGKGKGMHKGKNNKGKGKGYKGKSKGKMTGKGKDTGKGYGGGYGQIGKGKGKTTMEEKTTIKEKAKDQFATSAIVQGIVLEIAECQSTRSSSRMITITMLPMTGTMAAMTTAGTATIFMTNNRSLIHTNNLQLPTLHSSKHQPQQDSSNCQ